MRQLLLAVLVAGSLASDADLVQLEEENLRLKELLEQETNTLDSILDKAAAFHSCSGGTCSEPPKPPPKPVSPKSPRRRLSHTAGQIICAAAATPDFPFAANSGWLTPPAERVSSNVTVSAGSDAPGVSWSLNCDGLDHPITGGAGSTIMHEIPTGACTLSMWSENGDGWNGAQWSAPGWNLGSKTGPFSLSSGGSGSESFTVMPAAGAFQYMTSATDPSSTGADAGPGGSGFYFKTVANFTVRPASFALGFNGAEQCKGAAVATVSFQYHMFETGTGTLSLKTAEGATLWTKSGQQSSSADDTGWTQSETVPVNSASFHFEYVVTPPQESGQLLPTAAVAQMQVCCAPPMSSTTTTFVHHSVPHSFADAAACLHTEGPPLTIRESATSTVSATQTPPRDSNHLVC